MKLSQLILTVTFTGSSALYTHGRQRRSAADCPVDWINDPNDDTVCIPDGSDFAVNCGAQSMTVEFAYNHLYENIQSFLTGNSQLETGSTVIATYGTGTCDLTRDANWNGAKFSIEIMYSDTCLTLAHSGGVISISTLFEGNSNLATETDFDNNVGIHVGQLLSFTASCQWSDTETINLDALTVFTDDFSPLGGTPDYGDSGYTGFTPTFTMRAYSDSTFGTSIDPAVDEVEIGEKIYIQIESDDSLGQNGMFEWFVTDCTVYQTDTSGVSYPIITVSNRDCFVSQFHTFFRTAQPVDRPFWMFQSAHGPGVQQVHSLTSK